MAEKEREVTESSIKKSEKTEIPMKTTTEEDYKDTESVVTEKTSLGGTKDETPAIENLNVKEDTKEVDTKVSQNQVSIFLCQSKYFKFYLYFITIKTVIQNL